MSESDIMDRIESLSPEKRAQLFEKLKQRRQQQQGEMKAAIERQSRASSVLPVSFSQQRLWFLEQYEPDTPQYNLPQVLRLQGALDLGMLQRALDAMVARQESLRTTFSSIGGDPVQVIAEPGPVDIRLVDLSGLPARDAEAARLIEEEALRPFNLGVGPLMRVILFKMQPDEHLLMLNLHHIITDGWSQGVLMGELAAYYKAFVRNESPALPELPIQYADFALWQKQWLQGEVLDKQLNYWKKQLANTPPLDLPTDRPRPAMRTYNGTIATWHFPKELTDALKAYSQGQEATLFMTVLAGFQALLYHYTGQEDVPVGTLIANRRWAEIEGLIGFFANTLVMRTDLSGDPTFKELTHRARKVALEAYAHQDLPFEKLVDELNLKRDLSRTPLFQVMCILHNFPSSGLDLPGLTLSSTDADSKTSKFDLTLYLIDTPAGLAAHMEYNTDLFDASTMQRLLGHLQTLLEGVMANPELRLSQFPILSDEEKVLLLSTWNDTVREYAPRGIHQLVTEQAARTPEATAVTFGGESLTYAGLEARTNQLAHYLQGLGVKPGHLVGVCMDRCMEMVVSVLAILKAGGAYVPLDPHYPQDRLAYIVEDSRAAVLLTMAGQQEAAEKLRAGAGRDVTLVVLDQVRGEIDLQPATEPAVTTLPESLAYVLHTSGSTGKPKGVLIPHRGLVNFLLSMQERLKVTAADTLVAVTTLSFDIAGLELYLPLTVGAHLIVASRDVAGDGEQLRDLLVKSEATAMQATPATWRLLLGAGWPGSPEFKILCGGEALPRELANELLAKGAVLWNLYGPTETTVWSTARAIEAGNGPIFIGDPIANTQIYLLNKHLKPVAVSVPGELYIAGAGLAWGYLNRAGMTAERFLPDPFSAKPGARMYRTGDLVRYLPDGRIEFLGRIDNQVKVRGYRIELGEIESVLNQHPGIAQAVVIVREDTPGDKRLVAYLVAAGAEAPGTSELRQFVKQSLPDYMTPALFIPLPAMPLTPNGKVDRRALPAPESSRPDLKANYVAPRTPQEETLAKIWSELLGVERVGINDNFFELGGDSLKVIRVVGRAAQAGMTLTTKQIFQFQTVAELAQAVGSIQIQAEQGPVTGDMLLTFSMFQFFELGHPNPDCYCMAFHMQAKEVLDPALVEKAMTAIYRHHDSLRVRLIETADGYRILHDEIPEKAPFEVVDFSALPEEEIEEAIKAYRTKLDLEIRMQEGNLFRTVFFNLGDRPSHIMMIGHYLTADVLSWQMVITDLDLYYQKLARGEEINLPRKTTSVKQWVNRITKYIQESNFQQEFPYWFSDARRQATRIPRDHPEGANLVSTSRFVNFRLEPEVTAALTAVGKRYNTQIDTVILTAIAWAFTRWSGDRSLLLDLFVTGRESPFEDMDLSRTVGWLTFCYPLLLTLGQTADIPAALLAVIEQVKQVPNKGVGYPSLRYIRTDLPESKALLQLPQTEVFFNFFGVDEENGASSIYENAWGVTAHYEDRDGDRPRVIAMSGEVSAGILRLGMEYSSNVHDRETIEALMGKIEETLRFLAKM